MGQRRPDAVAPFLVSIVVRVNVPHVRLDRVEARLVRREGKDVRLRVARMEVEFTGPDPSLLGAAHGRRPRMGEQIIIHLHPASLEGGVRPCLHAVLHHPLRAVGLLNVERPRPLPARIRAGIGVGVVRREGRHDVRRRHRPLGLVVFSQHGRRKDGQGREESPFQIPPLWCFVGWTADAQHTMFAWFLFLSVPQSFVVIGFAPHMVAPRVRILPNRGWPHQPLYNGIPSL